MSKNKSGENPTLCWDFYENVVIVGILVWQNTEKFVGVSIMVGITILSEITPPPILQGLVNVTGKPIPLREDVDV